MEKITSVTKKIVRIERIMKYLVSFLAGCALSAIVFLYSMAFYSDYRAEALILGWGSVLEPHLKKADKEYEKYGIFHFDLKKDDFYRANILNTDERGNIFISGEYRTTLFFSPVFDEKNKKIHWQCISNVEIKYLGKYKCS